MNPIETTLVRVDLPRPDGGAIYFYIRPEYAKELHPWWGELFQFLLTLTPRRAAGTHPDSGAPMEVATARGPTRRRLLEHLRTAPAVVVGSHRTLRIALRLLSQEESDVPIRFFGSGARPPGDDKGT